ncbi:putative GABA permease [Aspergillus clavatus NRRL 1]|uniref:Amino acid permease, putative n=1 Tax=Aspergillus clavatus (strain ATCC 1007 / CBS 513.65 / DSM 816 / NCTC 3887 / NRRL 1 / QM 1276 / 107) TaxID=344612 RepID=A1C5S6_ASPCL|nr:amino acid permease, putative [Aspergillus clavatus NRRL 1]EAW15044.1 amino acid permease, putative [Aspergillus clavatus NRRL 1]
MAFSSSGLELPAYLWCSLNWPPYMAPTSGGQYHWISMLAPRWTVRFLSYMCGWLTVIGWQATFATACFLSGTLIQGLVVLTHPDYVPTAWHRTMYFWAVTAFAVGINLAGRNVLPKFEGLILVVHILGFFAVLIPLVTLADTGSAKDVFTQFVNEGGWSSQGLSFFIGLVGCVFAFAGGDAAVHMSEEIQNAPVVVPRSIFLSVLINGLLGFGMLIALLFCLGDINEALASPTGYPFMEIFYKGTGSLAGAATMTSIVIVVCICSTTGMMAAASRQFWSFSRDRGVPGWRLWSRVSPTTLIPVWSVVLTTVVSVLLALIPIGSTVAFNDLVAMSISGLYLSYIMVACLLLWRRLTGSIALTASAGETVNTIAAKLVWGPFRVPGIWGVLINIFAILYAMIAIFFSLWPTYSELTVEMMNFSVVGTVAVILISVVYYLLRARRVYQGPIVETVPQ